MSKAEKFIQNCTRCCSNELISVESRAGKEIISYNKWLTPEQARKAVEIAREEIIENAYTWLKEKGKDYIIVDIDNKYEGVDGLFLEDFKKYIKGE